MNVSFLKNRDNVRFLLSCGALAFAWSTLGQVDHAHAKDASPAEPEERAEVEVPPSIPSRGEPSETWFVDLGVSVNSSRRDAYTRQLTPRLHRSPAVVADFAVEAAAGAYFSRYFGALVRYDHLDEDHYESVEGAQQSLWWKTHALSVGPRARLPLWEEWFSLFAEATVGLAIARVEERGLERDTRRELGVALRGVAGVFLGGEHIGAYLNGGYTYAPVLEAPDGSVHDSGGFVAAVGVRARSLHWWW
jgi:hypothetical protein